MDVCDFVEDVLLAVEPFAATEPVIVNGFFSLFDFLMRYNPCEVHHLSLSSRLKMFKSKPERPHQTWEAHRIKQCVYLIPV